MINDTGKKLAVRYLWAEGMRKDKRCLDCQKMIKESESALQRLEKAQTKALLRDRMRFLRLLKSGECTSVAEAGRQTGLKLRAWEKLWRKYREERIQGLPDYPFKGDRGKLSGEQKQQLEEKLHRTGLQSLHAGCHFVEKTFGVSYTPSGIRYVFGRLKVKKKTAPLTCIRTKQAKNVSKKSLSPPEAALSKTHLYAR